MNDIERSSWWVCGEEITTKMMISAYSRGYFPMVVADSSHDDQNGEEQTEKKPQEVLGWFRPKMRCVLFFDQFHVSRTMKRVLRRGDFQVSWNESFNEVMNLCAEREETWLSPALREVYAGLHLLGLAESVEVRRGSSLVGGVYGVHLLGVFFAESMFSSESNMSKVALHYLIEGLSQRGLKFIDCQYLTAHLQSLGAVEIRGDEFLQLIHKNMSSAAQDV